LLCALGRFCSYTFDAFFSVNHGRGVEPQTHRKTYEVGLMQRV
jgi:hypothetical protein